VKRFEFDDQLGPYNLDSYGDWKQLSSYLSQSVIERLGMRDTFSFFPPILNSYGAAVFMIFSIEPTNELVIICVWFVQSQSEGKLQLHWRHHGWIELPKLIWRDD
jgi:hypothetical protein